MRQSLIERIDQASAEESCAAIVLTGAGEAFCAGQDLAETASIDVDDEASAHAWIDDFDRPLSERCAPCRSPLWPRSTELLLVRLPVLSAADLRIGHAGVGWVSPRCCPDPSITGIWAMWDVLRSGEDHGVRAHREVGDGAEAASSGCSPRSSSRTMCYPPRGAAKNWPTCRRARSG